MLRRMRAGNYLTLNETLCEPFSYCHSLRYLADRCGASVEDNDAEIIRATVEEMFDRLDGQTSEDAKTAELHVRAGRIYQSHNVFGMARLAREFLRRHSGLIE
jgi:hypothetical protein